MTEAKKSGPRNIDDSTFVNTTGLPFPRKYLSHSQISKYEMCPAAYRFSYIDNLPEIMGPAAIVGITAHQWVEDLINAGTPKYSRKDSVDSFQAIFEEKLNEIGSEYSTEERREAEVTRNAILPSAIAYYENVVPKLDVVACEIQVDAPIPIVEYKFKKGSAEIEEHKLGEVSVVGFIDSVVNNMYKHGEEEKSGVRDVKSTRELTAEIPAEELKITDIKTGVDKSLANMMAQSQLFFYSYGSGIRKVGIDNLVKSKAKKVENIRSNYNLLEMDVNNYLIGCMLERYCSTAYKIGKGHEVVDVDGSRTTSVNPYMFPRRELDFWKCNPGRCGHYYHCRGSQVANMTEKISCVSLNKKVAKKKKQ